MDLEITKKEYETKQPKLTDELIAFVDNYKKQYYYENKENIGKKEYKSVLGTSIYCVQDEIEKKRKMLWMQKKYL